jgi:hypothetical protein
LENNKTLPTPLLPITPNSPPNDASSEIGSWLDHKPEFRVRVDELEAIAHGAKAQEVSEVMDFSFWFDDFMPSLNWWREVSDSLLHSKDVDLTLPPEPSFAAHRQTLSKLLNDTLSAFSPAWQVGCYVSDDWLENGRATLLELLKRYRLFTRYVCALAQEIWPDVNLERLLEQS